jgi:hypothetical protein
MRLPDGGIDGSGTSNNGYQSLQKLYAETIPSIRAVNSSSSYSKAALSATLLSLMNSYQPDSINTLDYVGFYGEGDHSDHYTVAYLTEQAQQQYTTPHGFAGYEGYNISSRASNLSDQERSAKSSTFYTYGEFDYRTCSTAESCAGRPEGSWLSRQYTVGTPRPIPSPTTPAPSQTASATAPPTTPAPGTNVARAGVATASSEAPNQGAAKAIDGVVDGYPGDGTKEWATNGGRAGSFLQVRWANAVTVDRVVLHDRPNTSDRVTRGTLQFSDGSTVAVPSLPNNGAPLAVTFTARATTTLRFTVNTVSNSTSNVGLAELQAWAPGATATTPPPTTASPTATATTTAPPGSANVARTAAATASSENLADGQSAAKAIDGTPDGYPGDYTKEWATVGGRASSWLQLTWSNPVTINRVVLHDRPNTSDQITGGTLRFSDGTTVSVPSLPNGGTALTVNFSARSTTSLRFTATSVSASTGNVGLAELQAWTP